VIVPSKTLFQLVRDAWRLPVSQITQIPNGVDSDRFGGQPDQRLLSELGIPPDRLIVGTVATLRPEKNIPRLLKAFAQIKDKVPVTLVIVGDGAERLALKSRALEMGLSDTVIFTGPVEDPARLLGAFDIFALSSDTEQMPISVLEAMASSLPVAGVDVGDVKEMVSPENSPFITGGDLLALAASMLDLLSDADKRRRIGATNRQRVCKEYTLDRMVTSYTDLYRALIQSHLNSQAPNC
jgi:glycosyltransferase involved in cell wall biosynthesis